MSSKPATTAVLEERIESLSDNFDEFKTDIKAELSWLRKAVIAMLIMLAATSGKSGLELGKDLIDNIPPAAAAVSEDTGVSDVE